jgi:chaperonin cofactor prefoldin
MRTSRIPLFALLVAAAACGPGKIDSPEDGVEAVNDVCDEIVDVLETVKDVKSAQAAKPKLDALDKRMDDIERQMEKLGGEPDPKAQAEMMKSMEKVFEAHSKLPNDPEVHKVLGEMGGGR